MSESSKEGIISITKLLLWLFAIFLMSIPFWIMWNNIIPDVFNLPEITYIQAAGIMFIAQFLRIEINFPSGKGGK